MEWFDEHPWLRTLELTSITFFPYVPLRHRYCSLAMVGRYQYLDIVYFDLFHLNKHNAYVSCSYFACPYVVHMLSEIVFFYPVVDHVKQFKNNNIIVVSDRPAHLNGKLSSYLQSYLFSIRWQCCCRCQVRMKMCLLMFRCS